MRIAFTSCCKLAMDSDQRGWSRIASELPDLLLLLGDNVYLRRNNILRADLLERKLDDAYEAQAKVPTFKALVADMAKRRGILATWDDHDSFGNNRYGVDGAHVKAATRSFLRHMTFGTARTTIHTCADFDGIVRVILLDVRSFRDAPGDDRSADAMLGAKQWAWLESRVRDPARPKFVFVGSGTCFYGDHGDQEESWEDYPAAAARLTALLDAPGVVFLSGDIHKNSVGGLGKKGQILEFVASGIARRKAENYGLITVVDPVIAVDLVDRDGKRDKHVVSYANWPNT